MSLGRAVVGGEREKNMCNNNNIIIINAIRNTSRPPRDREVDASPRSVSRPTRSPTSLAGNRPMRSLSTTVGPSRRRSRLHRRGTKHYVQSGILV